MVDILTIAREAVERRASDIHLTVEAPPTLRIDGRLAPLAIPSLKGEDTQAILRELIPAEHVERFRDVGEADFSWSVAGLSRFRVNAYRQRGSVGLALRLIPPRPLGAAELGLPEAVMAMAKRPRGLVLVTGPTGSGKSTTLAALIDQINREQSCHIVTLEDPIEYLHRHEKSIINQRELGADTMSFAAGLRAALRQDPDVIMVGEMRDTETMGIALTAAETGHLVLATLHTGDATGAIDRIIDGFPPNQQEQIRVQLAGALEGVVAQRLLRRRDGTGRVAAMEILLVTGAARNLIREGKTHQLISVVQTGGKFGMQTMDMALRKLVRDGLIDEEDLAVTGGSGETGLPR